MPVPGSSSTMFLGRCSIKVRSRLGADCVVYSATKHIDGQGRVLGGVILGLEKLILDHYHQILRQTGPSLSPFNAWVLLKGLETLPVRVQRQTDNAGTGRQCACRPQENHAIDLPRSARPPAGRHHPKADACRIDALLIRGERRQGRRVPFSQCPATDRDHEQSRRREEVPATHPTTTTHQRLTPERAPNSASVTD